MADSPKAIVDNTKLFATHDHAKTYHRYRPTYPPSVFKPILDYLACGNIKPRNNKYGVAIDMACGTGQATSPLAEYFERVYGCDVSEGQIKEAKQHNKHENIEYHVAPCESMSFIQDNSVDLVTCAIAFHWVDTEKTYVEMERILKSGGVMAVYAYCFPVLETKEATDVYTEFWKDTLHPHASPYQEILTNQYRDVKLPFDDETRVNDISIEVDMPLSSFIGYVESYSPYQNLLKNNPGSNVMQVFSKKLRSIVAPDATTGEDPVIHVSYPIFIVMGRKK